MPPLLTVVVSNNHPQTNKFVALENGSIEIGLITMSIRRTPMLERRRLGEVGVQFMSIKKVLEHATSQGGNHRVWLQREIKMDCITTIP